MDAAAIRAKKERPFDFEFFNVKCYTANPASRTKEVPVRLVNCITKARNDRTRLPKYIILVPDADIVKNINYYNFGFRSLAEKDIEWMAKTIKKELELRKDELAKVQKGSILYREPKIIWVEMIDRIHIIEKYLAMSNKFNGAMHATLANYRDNYVMSINRAMFDTSLFTLTGKLNNQGKEQYWNEIDKQLQDFEQGRISLQPICDKPKSEILNASANKRYCMPSPPHRRRGCDKPTSSSFAAKRFQEYQGSKNRRY